MLTIKEMKVLEKNSEQYGITEDILMENAGRGIAEILLTKFKVEKKKVLIAAGYGNNGGDGFVAARYLQKKGVDVSIWLVGSPENIKTSVAKMNFNKIDKTISVHWDIPMDDLNKVDLVVDALLGAGLRGNLSEQYRYAVDTINRSDAEVVAVDVPTGFGTDLFVNADATITMHDIKEGMNTHNCGTIYIVDIGIPHDAMLYTGMGDMLLYPVPKKEAKKGDNGKVAVIGGGPYTGAVYFALMGALKIGADLAYAIVPESINDVMAAYSPDIITIKYNGEHLNKEVISIYSPSDYNAIVMGMGIGRGGEIERTFCELIKKTDRPMVIDADGLHAIKKHLSILNGKKAVLTPHRGEFEMLTDIKLDNDLDNKIIQVKKFAEKIDQVVVLKGVIDIVTDGRSVKLNRTGNSRMSVGGTGDLLSGIIGGLIGKGMDLYNAAVLGTYINGFAGDIAFNKKRWSMTTSDVIDELSNVFITHNV